MTAIGVSLLVVGAVVVLAEAHTQSLGLLGGPGVLMLGIGAVFAVSGLGGGIILGLLLAAVLAAAGVGVVWLSLSMGMAARRRRVRAGPEGLIGHIGVVRAWAGQAGRVSLDGALWQARRGWTDDDEDEDAELHEGEEVVVEQLDGLTLRVRRAERWELVR
ncbi:MAG: NfeD family protein [Solirubrobacterales bacterium]|nr:NfeD family protein [Solirubrobacterales bacterium]MBV9714921.1 NfeD family protein [Solirubrobacterales bacterium]